MLVHQTLSLSECDLKFASTEGAFSGYGSVFGVKDSVLPERSISSSTFVVRRQLVSGVGGRAGNLCHDLIERLETASL